MRVQIARDEPASLLAPNLRALPRGRLWQAAARAAYVVLVGAGVFLSFAHWAYDDPFITYRYARNLGDGLGFVYNPGERVLSTTTPFLTLLLALLGELWPDLPRLANLIGALSLALGALFIWELARAWRTPIVGVVALLLYPTFTQLLTPLGSETPLYLAFCLGAFACYARERFGLAAACAALALLTRADGALVALLLAAHFLLRRRRPIPWGVLLVFAAIAVPWFAFAWSYFGSLFPATLAAKQHQGVMAESVRFAPGLLLLVEQYATRWHYVVEGMLALVGLAFALRVARAWLLFLLWPLLYFVAYTALGVSRYPWYYAPLVPGFLAAVGLGLAGLVALVHARGAGRASTWMFRCLAALLAVTILLLGVLQAADFWRLRGLYDRRVVAYQAVGNWLRATTPSSVSVGALEVGVIGYYSRRPMVDFAGLIQPEVAGRLTAATTYEDAAIWAVERYRPDYLVLHDGSFPRLEQGAAREHCTRAARLAGETYGYSRDLTVYACEWPGGE